MRRKNAWLILGFGVVSAALGVGLFLWSLGRRERTRIVRSEALMAFDANGLRQLDDLYALPSTCSRDLVESTADVGIKFRFLQLCYPAQPAVTNQMASAGVVLIPKGTKAMYIARRFILPGGSLIDPYPADTYDMARDGAVEVERIRVAQLPQALEGWVVAQFLGRECCGL